MEFSKDKVFFSVLFLLRQKPGIRACGKDRPSRQGGPMLPPSGLEGSHKSAAGCLSGPGVKPISQAAEQRVCRDPNTSRSELAQSAPYLLPRV